MGHSPDWIFPFETRLDELDKLDNAYHRALDTHHIVHKDCSAQREGLKSKEDEMNLDLEMVEKERKYLLNLPTRGNRGSSLR